MEVQHPAGGRARDRLFRRGARPRPRPGAGHQGPAAAAAGAAAADRVAGIRDPLGSAGRGVGGDRRRPAGPDLPAAGRRSARSTRRRRGGPPRYRRTATTWWCSRTGSPRCANRSAAARWSASPPTTTPRSPSSARRRVRTVFEAWVDRTQVLSALPETRQVYCFENKGEEIGVTLHHPHGQIYAFPFVTPADRADGGPGQPSTHAPDDGGNLFDDLVAAELRTGTRDRDQRTSTGSCSCPRRRAGPTRCASSPPTGCPT